MTIVSTPSIEITSLGGNCPVQAEGFIDGQPFYFRARGNRWTMGIGGADTVLSPDWFHEALYGDAPFAAGWMDDDEARHFIAEAAALYRASQA